MAAVAPTMPMDSDDEETRQPMHTNTTTADHGGPRRSGDRDFVTDGMIVELVCYVLFAATIAMFAGLWSGTWSEHRVPGT